MLINHETFSAATYFAAAIKCNQIATVIGTPASQPLISNGDLNRFQLPNTKLHCYTSLSTLYFPCNQGKPGIVEPDILIEYTLNDLLNDYDRTLETVLKLIRNDEL